MTLRRLLVGAALLHVVVAVLLLVAGRTRLAPSLIDRDGIVARAAADSYVYQHAAIPLAAALQRGDLAAWTRTAAPLHARLISIPFAVLSPLAGYTPLAAEPFNLCCYLAVIALVFAIAREAAGRSVALTAAALAALWPTFVVHTLQLLKDPLFIAGALAVVFIVLTMLTADYGWFEAAGVSALLLVASGLVFAIRPPFVLAVVVLIGVALALLVVRQIGERRLLIPNLVCAATTLAVLVVAVIALAGSPLPHQAVKRLRSPDNGEAKSSVVATVPTSIWRSASRRGRWEALDRASLALGSLRSRFAYSNGGAGAGIDDAVVFLSARDLVAYLPRAAAVGLWAPFPNTWLARGRTVGASGRLLAALETVAIYLCEGLALVAALRRPRRLAAVLLLAFAVFGVTAEAVVVANLGALYRFRYAFWFLLIALGAIGLAKLRPHGRGAAAILLAGLSASCTGAAPPAPGTMRVANVTGFPISVLYLVPRDARTWQENVLGADVLTDGRAVDIRLPPDAAPVAWDLCVEGGDGYRGKWRDLDLSKVSILTLRIANGTLVADLEGTP